MIGRKMKDRSREIESCDLCGLEMPLDWFSDDALYRRVTGRAAGPDQGGSLCPQCFDVLAQERDLHLRWVPILQTDAMIPTPKTLEAAAKLFRERTGSAIEPVNEAHAEWLKNHPQGGVER